MRFLGLGCLVLLACLFLPSNAHAASYPPDLVCYMMDNTTTPPTPLCAANEYVKTCTSHPMTHLADVGGGTIMCVDNAPLIPPPLLDAWYPAYSDPYMYMSCPVPNTHLYTGPAAVPANSCISTSTTPQDDSYAWFCEDNVNYFAEWGPQGYKCVLRTPETCPGIPPHHLSPLPGYPHAYECVADNPPMPTCSSTEVLTLVFTGPPDKYTCIQSYPWTSAAIPTPVACPSGETLISNGQTPPADRYGCALSNSCPAGQTFQQTSPPGVVPAVFACSSSSPTCPAGKTLQSDTLVNPIAYTCCPDGDVLNINRATTPPTYTCVAPPTPTPATCPPGQVAVPDPGSAAYYICSPATPAVCPPGQNGQNGICVANSSHIPNCGPGQTPTLVTPGNASYTCQAASPTCPAGQIAQISNPNPLTYTCVPDGTVTCSSGYHMEGTPDPMTGVVNYTCVADAPGTPPTCPAGQSLNILSYGPPPTYSCVVLPVAIPSCPPGQYAAVINFTPITYGCKNGGN